jgi:uroporphyrinogen decarboxylase
MSVEIKNDRLIRALLRQPVDMTPVWIMRQAGRYLPEYRKTRERAGDFMTLCKTPELACEVTLQPLARFDLDAAILFSDILTIPDAMGLGLSVIEKQGPKFEHPVRTVAEINKLGVPDPESDLAYVIDAVRLIHKELDDKVPLIGFSGSPWTLATYMVEGESSKTYSIIKCLLYNEPKTLHVLMNILAKSAATYLNAQINAGVEVVMVFDTWGGILAPDAYREFSLQYMQQVVDQLQREYYGKKIPVILFSKGIGTLIHDLANSGCDAVGLDWTQDIAEIRELVGNRVALQGNLDPAVLYASPDVITDQVSRILAGFGSAPGHVFNLGHGIHPEVNPDHVKVLVDSVHELSKPYHN